MTFNQLRYVVAISKYGSFSKASEALKITQPALTLQIKKLEDEIGLVLFDRSQKQISLTREGEVMMAKATQILSLVDNLSDVAIELEDEINGKLNIGIIPTIAPYITPLFIDELNKNYPKLKLNIIELITEDVVSRIKTGELDLGVISTPVQAKGVVFTKLFYEKFYLFVSDQNELYSNDTVKIKEIDLNDLWYLNEGNCFQNQVNALCKFSEKLIEKQNFRYQSNSIESLRYIVENRGGITFIPELATLTISSEKEGMVKDIEGILPVREISMITSKFVAKQKLIDAFLEILLTNIPERMKSMQANMILDTKIITN